MKSAARKHVLLLPFPAYGHVIPLLELGKKLFKHHDVTFAVSESMVEHIYTRELMARGHFPVIAIPDRFVELDAENVGSTVTFDSTMDTVMPAVRRLLTTIPVSTGNTEDTDATGIAAIAKPVDVVIGDNILAEALVVCHERNLPFHFFNTASASFMTLASLVIEEADPTLPDTEEAVLAFSEPIPLDSPPSPVSAQWKRLLLTIKRANYLARGIIFNSVEDMEEKTIQAIRSHPIMQSVSLRFVGPLLPDNQQYAGDQLEQQENVLKWLNSKADASVVYVSFGSIAVPPPEQISELAQALLTVGRPFIWSLSDIHHQHLPAALASQVSNHNNSDFLLLAWAPQKLILQHPATAVFLSHCGWNSTLECVSAGVPVVAWPMFADQRVNAQWLTERSLGVMIENTGLLAKHLVPTEVIRDVITQVGWENSTHFSSYRHAASTWKEKLNAATAPGGSSDIAFRELVGFFD